MSIENILDATLDDLADRPSITLFPNGAHKVTLDSKIDREKSTVQLTLTYVEPVELSDPGALVPVAGDKNSVFYFLLNKDKTPNAYNQGALKEVLGCLKEGGVEGSTTTELLEAAKGMEVVVVTKIRVGKGEYEGRDNLDIQKLMIV